MTLGQRLKTFFDAIIELDLQIWENFSTLGQVIHYPKDSILKQPNSTEKKFSLLLEGSGGILIWSENNYICTDLSFENDLIMDYLSFTFQKPTISEVRLFEDSVIFSIPHELFQKTMQPDAYGNQVALKALEGAYDEKLQQQIDLLSKTAKQRYLELSAKKPAIHKVPLKYLASYLGITPQSLSRIRNEKI